MFTPEYLQPEGIYVYTLYKLIRPSKDKKLNGDKSR